MEGLTLPWWRKLLALLGLSEDARVRVRAPGVEVVITGDAELVKGVLDAVKAELSARKRGRGGEPSISARVRSNAPAVRPSALDEMDSPYAIPQHRPADKDARARGDAKGEPARLEAPRPEHQRTERGDVEGHDTPPPRADLHRPEIPRTDRAVSRIEFAEPPSLGLRNELRTPKTSTMPEPRDETAAPGMDFTQESTMNADNLIESGEDDLGDEPPNEPTAVDVNPSGGNSLPQTLLPRVTEVQRAGRLPLVTGRRPEDD